MKTIRSKMLVLILLPVVVIFVGVTLIAYFQIKDNTSSTIEELTAEIAHKASDIVTNG
jgi:methyl-accepting chemotaxis protein